MWLVECFLCTGAIFCHPESTANFEGTVQFAKLQVLRRYCAGTAQYLRSTCNFAVTVQVLHSYCAGTPKLQLLRRSILLTGTAADVELGQCGWVPDEIRAFISHGAGQGERRPALFKFAAKLTRFGWTAEKVTAKLINAPFFKDDLKTEDMLRQVERGIQYGQGYEGY